MLASFLTINNNNNNKDCKATFPNSLAKFKVKGGKKEKRPATRTAPQTAPPEPAPYEAATTVLFHEFKPLPPAPSKKKKQQEESDSDEEDDDFEEAAVAVNDNDGGDGGVWDEEEGSDVDKSSVDYDYADSEGEAGSDFSTPSSLGEPSSFARATAATTTRRKPPSSKPVYTGPQLCAEEEDFD